MLPSGQIEGADLLIKGSITEFEPGSAGGGAGMGLGAFGLPGALIGGVLGGLRQSHVAMIVQVVDAKTSRLLFSTTVEGKANDFNIGGALAGFGGGIGGIGGLGVWQKTPVEKAIRVAILQAVKELSAKTPQSYFRHGEGAKLPAPSSAARDPLKNRIECYYSDRHIAVQVANNESNGRRARLLKIENSTARLFKGPSCSTRAFLLLVFASESKREREQSADHAGRRSIVPLWLLGQQASRGFRELRRAAC